MGTGDGDGSSAEIVGAVSEAPAGAEGTGSSLGSAGGTGGTAAAAADSVAGALVASSSMGVMKSYEGKPRLAPTQHIPLETLLAWTHRASLPPTNPRHPARDPSRGYYGFSLTSTSDG